MKKQLNEIKRMQQLAGVIKESQFNGGTTSYTQWKPALVSFIQSNLTDDIGELDMLNDVLREIIADNEQELADPNNQDYLSEVNVIDNDGYVDDHKLIQFLKNTMISKGYNLPEDFWLDMKENADFTIGNDEVGYSKGYFENFDEEDALDEVEAYLDALLDDSEDYPFLQDINSLEDFKQ
jgi:hypothetical protein